MSKVVVLGKTSKGKEIGYKELGYHRYMEICFKSGGQVPDDLKGNWTDVKQLTAAVNAYLATEKAAAETKKTKKVVKA